MPAAAVIPAPVAYIKVVAVKKLVVGFQLIYISPLLLGVSADMCLASFQGALPTIHLAGQL